MTKTIKARVVVQEPWVYTLYQAHDQYYLEVLAGTVGLFEAIIQLSPEECQRYSELGNAYIASLARDVTTRYPNKYQKRLVTARFILEQ